MTEPSQKLILDHIGIAVNNIHTAADLYRSWGYRDSHEEELPAHGVKVLFLTPNAASSPEIELIAPLGDASPVKKFLEKRGEGVHHLAYRVQDINAELALLASQGFQLIDNIARPGARGHKVAFIHPKSTFGTLIELCEH